MDNEKTIEICPKCGGKLDSKYHYCTLCNYKTSIETPAREVKQESQQPTLAGTPFGKKPINRSISITLVVLIIIAGLFWIFSDFIACPQKSITPPASQQNFINISAPALYNEYETNEVAANLKYKDKWLCVTGTISDIGQAVMDEPYITLSSEREYGLFGVNCYFPGTSSSQTLVASFYKGQRLTVYGRCSGTILGSIIISDCQIK